VLKSIPPHGRRACVCEGSFRGLSQREGRGRQTHASRPSWLLKLEINSWRWEGVPFYIRAGKCLPVTCTEGDGHIPSPARRVDGHSTAPRIGFRFRISPDVAIGLGAMDQDAGLTEMVGERVELLATSRPARGRPWTPTSGCWGTRCAATRPCLRARGLCGASMADRRAGARQCYARLFLRAQYLGHPARWTR